MKKPYLCKLTGGPGIPIRLICGLPGVPGGPISPRGPGGPAGPLGPYEIKMNKYINVSSNFKLYS